MHESLNEETSRLLGDKRNLWSMKIRELPIVGPGTKFVMGDPWPKGQSVGISYSRIINAVKFKIFIFHANRDAGVNHYNLNHSQDMLGVIIVPAA